MAGWWRKFEADLTAAGRALEREHQAAIVAGDLSQPRHRPQLQHERHASPDVDLEAAGKASRIDELLGQVADASGRLIADHACQTARAEYAARLEQETLTEPEPIQERQAQGQAEIEM